MHKWKLILISSASLLFLSGCGCNDVLEKMHICEQPKPKPYYEVGITYNRMHRDPNQACNYVANHASTFDTTFSDCGRQNITRFQAEIDRIQRYCESIFIDPADLIWCDEKYGVPVLKQKQLYLSAVLEVTNNLGGCVLVNCNCINFGNYFQPLIDFYNSNAPPNMTWQQLMDESLEATKQEFVCHY